MADKVTKICMDIYGKLEKSRVLNIIERLQISNILEICYLCNLQWKYVKKYISIQASIFLFVSSVLKLKSSTGSVFQSRVCQAFQWDTTAHFAYKSWNKNSQSYHYLLCISKNIKIAKIQIVVFSYAKKFAGLEIGSM
jgi:hypothetical protein